METIHKKKLIDLVSDLNEKVKHLSHADLDKDRDLYRAVIYLTGFMDALKDDKDK